MDDSNKSVLRFRVINCDRRPLSVPVPSRLVHVSFPRASTGGEITARHNVPWPSSLTHIPPTFHTMPNPDRD